MNVELAGTIFDTVDYNAKYDALAARQRGRLRHLGRRPHARGGDPPAWEARCQLRRAGDGARSDRRFRDSGPWGDVHRSPRRLGMALR